MRYPELTVTSNFSFLRGASHPEELVVQAESIGLSGISITDRNSLAGVVRGHVMAKKKSFPYRIGCRLVFRDGTPDIFAWPKNHSAYRNLCQLLTTGNLRAEKGDCLLDLADLLHWGEGLMLGVLPELADTSRTEKVLAVLNNAFPGYVRCLLRKTYGPNCEREMLATSLLAARVQTPLMACGDVLYHHHDRRPLQDVLTCIREHKKLTEAGFLLHANAERFLKPPEHMLREFRDYLPALHEAEAVFASLDFSLDELKYQYPDEPTGAAASPQEALIKLTWEGAEKRYLQGVPDKVKAQIEYELALIEKMQYPAYFLTVYDIVRFARSKDILCQGRGSAANSAVCFCLGITDVNPATSDLLFERFISEERSEPPDIDVDFEHERREEVIQYIYQRYGRDRAGLAATLITYRSRSALREVGKVFGYSEDAVAALSGTIWGYANGFDEKHVREAGFEMKDKHFLQMLDLARQIIGFPRHLSQHVGGFVITRDLLREVVPIMNAAMDDRTTVEWDKDDLEALGILKIDILALGMLSCLRRALNLLENHYDEPLTLASIPAEDADTYQMISRADTLGVFQIESRAQMSMLPRLKPKTFYDLVIEVAIVRPGPIQGDMVHPYLRRRQGLEEVSYPKEELREVLHKTLGVPLFQEQAMKIAIVAAGFRPSEADKLRRAMATFKRVGTIKYFRDRMVEGMVARGYEREFAERCFGQIEGFGTYGFPESHAASFALLVYASSWIKCHYPDVFCAAILNSQPMGFYAPAQLIRDAREHGVEMREVDINASDWDCTLEPLACPDDRAMQSSLAAKHKEMGEVIETSHAVRLGLRMVKGLPEADAAKLTTMRGSGYDSVRDLWLRAGIKRTSLEKLADADAFRSIGLDRRAALWAVRALDEGNPDHALPLFAHAASFANEEEVALSPMPLGEHVINDYQHLTFSLKAHPVSFLRDALAKMRALPCSRVPDVSSGRRISLGGLVLVRQRPGTAKGVVFITIEDETGVANLIVWPKVFEKYRKIVLGGRFIRAHGRLQSEAGVIHLVVEYLEDLTPLLARISHKVETASFLANADEFKNPIPDPRDKNDREMKIKKLLKQVPEIREDVERLSEEARRAMPRGRNFH